MAEYDEGRIYQAYQGLEMGGDAADGGEGLGDSYYVHNFKEFIKSGETKTGEAKEQTSGDHLHYYDQLMQQKTHLSVDLEHVRAVNQSLARHLEENPSQVLPLFERAAIEVLAAHQSDVPDQVLAELTAQGVQVLLYSSEPRTHSLTASIRDLSAETVNHLVQVTGIVTAASKPKHKATSMVVQCKSCKNTMTIACRPGMGGTMVPTYCTLKQNGPLAGDEKCEREPFQALPDRCHFADQQTLKLQEKPEDVPTGEMPRTVTIVVDRTLVGTVTPGTRITVLGIYSTFKGKGMDKAPAALQQPYIRVVSIQEEAGDSHSRFNFTKEEITEFEQFARQDRVHEVLFSRIAPNIYGAEDIKRAVGCLLFGGARKTLPDGTARRGDINVLLLGDPSTAKSQFLKFVSKVAPICVYTSGKGSSAAGLTASVVQDPSSREFYLEGGAMVLADNGVVCIDEFDKMRPEDRVAIHEAMEQQTISIAKAGITTMLKSRTSVLAAANPPSGRYDDLKSAQDNMDLQSTILSRFDLIFIVKDPASEERDNAIARKVLDNHRTAGAWRQDAAAAAAESDAAIEVDFLKRYIHYCRSQCAPRLGEGAGERLTAYYVEIREEARKAAERDDTDVPPVPVTVRQLEALVRISESLAKMSLQTEATLEHVEIAIELFRKSTMDAVKSGVATYNIASDPQRAAIHRLEDKIRRRVHIGGYITTRRLLDELVALGDPEPLVMRALCALDATAEFQLRRERSVVHRLR